MSDKVEAMLSRIQYLEAEIKELIEVCAASYLEIVMRGGQDTDVEYQKKVTRLADLEKELAHCKEILAEF